MQKLLKAVVGVMGAALARFRIRASLTVNGEKMVKNEEMNFKVSIFQSVLELILM